MSRTTLHSLGLALVIGLVVGASPFTPRGIVASLVSGSLVGAAVFGFRLARANGTGFEQAAEQETVVLPPLLFWAVLAALATAFAPTGLWLYRQWTSSIWTNGHGLFTPLVMGYLAYMALRRDRETGPESSPWGFPLLGVGLGLLVYDAAIRTEYLSALGLVLCIPGLCLLALGARRSRMLLLPLMVGFFMIPVPTDTAVQLVLRKLTAAGVVPLLDLFGPNFIRDDTAFLMPGVMFHISDACSGFATLYAAIGIAIILAVYTRAPWRRVLVLASTFPLALAANIVRVYGLMLLCHVIGPEVMESEIHPMSGVATFLTIAVVLFLVAGRRSVRAALS